MTDEEERQRQITAAIAEYFERLTAGLCPFCGVKIEKQVQVGRCVYAEPCNHRLYQGRAPRKR